MRRWHYVAVLICGGMTAVVLWQARELGAARNSAALAEPPPAAAAEPISNTSETPDKARELARLRNQVTQLRRQKRDLEGARAEHASLLEAQRTGAPVKPEPPPGFISQDKLSNAGFATPEDAVQTFFWAMREGNFAAAMQATSPNSPERKQFEKLSPENRAAMEQEFQGKIREDVLSHLTDVGVRSREIVSDDVVVLHVGSSLSTNTIKMRLERTAEGWKSAM